MNRKHANRAAPVAGLLALLVWALGVVAAVWTLANDTTSTGLLSALGVMAGAFVATVAVDLQVGDRDRRPGLTGVNW